MTTISSVRSATTQILFKVIKETAEQEGTASAAAGSLGRLTGGETKDDGAYYNRSLISSLDESARLYGSSLGTGETDEQAISSDIRTASFMAGLKEKLEAMADTGGEAMKKASAMLEALDAGTLTVIDAESGLKITAWNVSDPEEKSVRRKEGEPVDKENWSSFLKNRLMRGTGATFALAENGAYIDRTSGDNAFFGKVGDQNVYLSWPQASAAG